MNKARPLAGVTLPVVTTYTYDAANHLETAVANDSGIIWHYVYDNNGRRLQQLPGSLTPTEGAIQYTSDDGDETLWKIICRGGLRWQLEMKTGRSKSKFSHSNIVLVFSLMVLAACQFEGAANETVVVTQSVPAVAIGTSPSTTEEVVTLTVTHQPTVSSMSSTVTPATSPIPTLSLAEKETIALEYYMTNGNCELPCWWGIVPGEAEWQSVKSFFSTIATEITTSAESETDNLTHFPWQFRDDRL